MIDICVCVQSVDLVELTQQSQEFLQIFSSILKFVLKCFIFFFSYCNINFLYNNQMWAFGMEAVDIHILILYSIILMNFLIIKVFFLKLVLLDFIAKATYNLLIVVDLYFSFFPLVQLSKTSRTELKIMMKDTFTFSDFSLDSQDAIP